MMVLRSPMIVLRSMVLIILSLPMSVSQCEPLGRLFYSPSERQSLEPLRGKKQLSITKHSIDKPSTTIQEVTVPKVITVNGIVRRERRPPTIWMQPVAEKTRTEKASTERQPAADTANSSELTTKIVAGEKVIQVKPGQQWNTSANEPNELFEQKTIKDRVPSHKLLEIERTHAQ